MKRYWPQAEYGGDVEMQESEDGGYVYYDDVIQMQVLLNEAAKFAKDLGPSFTGWKAWLKRYKELKENQ